MRGLTKAKRMRQLPLHAMLVPSVVLLLVYSYGPILGSYIAFQRFNPVHGLIGSPWVGLDNFRFLLAIPGVFQIVWNTVYISFLKIVGLIFVPVVFSLLLNEVGKTGVKRLMQTIIYLPHFLSWVIMSGILIDILSPSQGIVNHVLATAGIRPIFFLGDKQWFPITLVLTEIWKSFGFGTVIYLAALTSIDPNLYEAATVDGANRWQQTLHVTLPGMMPIVVLMTVLRLGNILEAGFEQVLNLYSPQVYDTGDIIDTFVYRLGLEQAQYAVATAVGLFKSVISFILVSLSYVMADRFANYRIF